MAWTPGLVARYPASLRLSAGRLLRLGLFAAGALLTLPLAAPAYAATPDAKFTLPAANAFPSSLVSGPDGRLWFIESAKIGRISTSGAIAEFALPSGHNAKSIAPGPDGNLWFTEPSNGRVGRITTAGAITEFQLAGNGTYGIPINQPQQIVAGPDSKMWFTQTIVSRTLVRPVGGQIDSIDPASGVISTRVVLPTGTTKATTAIPDAIALGPDGAVWFADTRLALIERVTSDNTLRASFHVPAGSPVAIAFGRDGDLWLTANSSAASGSLVDRMTLGGVFSQAGVPPDSTTNGDSVGAIARGPDGNMWFTNYDMFSSLGSIWKLVVPSPSSPIPAPSRFRLGPLQEADSLTSGPDGALWYTTTDNSTGESAVWRKTSL